MVGSLLLRGMLIGVLAGFIAFGFARIFGEPQVDLAIAFEEQMAASEAAQASVGDQPAMEEAEDEGLPGRAEQAGLGLVTGLVIFGAAVGGIFSLVFALAYGRIGSIGARGLSAVLALAAFVSVVLVPLLKYPANPPAVSLDETIGVRTSLYFILLVLSVAGMAAAFMLARRLWAQQGSWNATLIASAAYLVFIGVVFMAMPAINEMPDGFSPDVLWNFRVSSVGIHVILWTVIGLGFGLLAERSFGEVRGNARLAGSYR